MNDTTKTKDHSHRRTASSGLFANFSPELTDFRLSREASQDALEDDRDGNSALSSRRDSVDFDNAISTNDAGVLTEESKLIGEDTTNLDEKTDPSSRIPGRSSSVEETDTELHQNTDTQLHTPPLTVFGGSDQSEQRSSQSPTTRRRAYHRRANFTRSGDYLHASFTPYTPLDTAAGGTVPSVLSQRQDRSSDYYAPSQHTKTITYEGQNYKVIWEPPNQDTLLLSMRDSSDYLIKCIKTDQEENLVTMFGPDSIENKDKVPVVAWSIETWTSTDKGFERGTVPGLGRGSGDEEEVDLFDISKRKDSAVTGSSVGSKRTGWPFWFKKG